MGKHEPEFAVPSMSRDRGWSEMRERLSDAARDMHFFAFSRSVTNSAALLVISEHLAGMAMSIPLEPAHIGSIGLVDSSTLFATQVLQLDHRATESADTAVAD